MGAPRWEHLHHAGPAGPALRHRLRCGQGRGECGCLPPPNGTAAQRFSLVAQEDLLEEGVYTVANPTSN